MKKIITIATITIILLTTIIIYYINNYHKETYLIGVKHSQLATELQAKEENGILKNYNDYLNLIKQYSIEQTLNENDLEEKNYLYYILQIDSCSERIKGVREVKIKKEIATIIFDIDKKCGVCAPTQEIYLIPVTKDETITKIEAKYNTVSKKTCDETIAYKPILYLYPEKETNITVKLEHPERLLTTYPKYKDGWNIKATPNGDIYDEKGTYYYALYWDETTYHHIDFQEGFYVTKEKAITFLEKKLDIIGLTPKERNEFIMYWLPILEKNQKNIIYFELTEELEKDNKLIITPKPDEILRVIIHIKKVDKEVSIKEQQLKEFKRIGFTAVEWGGVIHK